MLTILYFLLQLAVGEEIVYKIDTISWDKISHEPVERYNPWNTEFDGIGQLVSYKERHDRRRCSRKLSQISRVSQNRVADEAIIGSDDRFVVQQTTKFPFSAVGMLEFQIGDSDGKGKCTGTMISESSLLTSAHCIWDSRLQTWNKNFMFYPARDGNKHPYGEFKLKGVSIPNAWIQQGAQPYDYAVVTLNSPIGNQTGYFGFGYDCGWEKNLSYDEYGLIGFPFDKFGEQWMGVCNAQAYNPCQGGNSSDAMLIQHNCDTLGGQSGSVLWKILDKQIHIRAIHQGFSYDEIGFNNAVAITPSVFQFILRNFKEQ